jgi:hypothetical protein
MGKKLEIIVAPHHRFDELSLRHKDGSKTWVNKWQVTVIDLDTLAEHEDDVIDRYVREGRIVVVELVEPSPRAKARRQKEVAADDVEE